jgi:hypothetical protein
MRHLFLSRPSPMRASALHSITVHYANDRFAPTAVIRKSNAMESCSDVYRKVWQVGKSKKIHKTERNPKRFATYLNSVFLNSAD